MSAKISGPVMLTTEEAARYIDVPASTLVAWRSNGRADGGPVPEPTPVSPRRMRYQQDDLDAYLVAVKEWARANKAKSSSQTR